LQSAPHEPNLQRPKMRKGQKEAEATEMGGTQRGCIACCPQDTLHARLPSESDPGKKSRNARVHSVTSFIGGAKPFKGSKVVIDLAPQSRMRRNALAIPVIRGRSRALPKSVSGTKFEEGHRIKEGEHHTGEPARKGQTDRGPPYPQTH